MDPTKELLILQSPRSPSEWHAYFDLRWRILRQPWGQPRGSERDSEDDSAFHLLLMDAAGKALTCSRLHLTAPGEAQLRYMAVDEHARGCGYGGRILEKKRWKLRPEAVVPPRSCLTRAITPLNSIANAATA